MKGLIFEMSCQDHNQISLPSSVHVVVLLLSEKEEKLHIRYCYFKSLLCPDQFKLIFMGENLWKLGQKQSTIHQNNEILCLLLEMLGFDAAMIFQKSTLSQVLTHRIWQIQLWCPRSKWNMGAILAFLAWKWLWKVV